MVRVKYRYILGEIITETHTNVLKLPLRENDLKQAIIDSVQELHGDFGLACILAGFSVKMFNPTTRIIMLRVRRQFHSVLCTSLPMVTSAGRLKLGIRTLRLSGTIQSAHEFLVNYDKTKLRELVQKHNISAEDQQELAAMTENCQHRLANLLDV